MTTVLERHWLTAAQPFVSHTALNVLADEYARQYQKAEPFPHAVIDNIFDPAVLDAILEVFPKPDAEFWHRFNDTGEIKLASNGEEDIPQPIRLFLYFLNSSIFTSFLERLTGIEGLIPDPHFSGGGLHQIERGGKLSVHVDFNQHKRLRLDRRLNLLLYLNRDWSDDYGGLLELWDRNMTRAVQKVAPLFNRMVVFSTTDFSYHGHPDPLTCPRDRTRRSIALYYYTNGRPDEEVSDNHTTVFAARPGEKLNTGSFKTRLGKRVKPFVPPVLIDLYKHRMR